MNPQLIATFALFALLAAPDSRAADQDLPFDKIQSECVPAGTATRAALGGSATCTLTKGRWFSTIEHDDFYQAQYCLRAAADAASCQQRGLLLFANRAYTPTARLTLERIDPAGTSYDDPQVYVTAYGHVLGLTVRPTQGAAQTSYYRWKDDRWQVIDTSSWQSAAGQRLPPGSRLGTPVPPDFESLHSRVDVFRRGDPACCASALAEIDFELAGDRLAVKALRVQQP